MLEVIISLSILSSALIGLNAISNRYSDDTTVTLVASQERAFGEAAKAYIKDNYSAVMASSTATSPALIEVATLITAGNLPAGFLNTNGYGQSMCALVLQPAASRLQAIVVSEGGTVIDDLSLGSLAGIVGGSGGGVYASDATTIRGAIGGWAIPTTTFHNLANNVNRKCDGTAGKVQVAVGHPVMSLWFENGDTSSAFLARDAVPGRPELNAMNTPIVMNSVQTTGTACTAGAIARDATGTVLSCNIGTLLWKAAGGSQYWQDPVSNFASLPACNAAAVNQTRVAQTPSTGVGPRAYTCDGSAWKALAVDDGGNLVANRGQFSRDGMNPCCGDTGSISLAESTFSTGRTANISLHDAGISEGNIELANVAALGGARRIRMYDNQGQGMGLELTGNLQLNRVESIGGGCSPNGLVARDGTGLLLSCQNGVWENNYACRGFSGDLNWLEGQAGTTSCYNGAGLGNAPTADWYFVEVMRHINGGNFYVSQRATIMTGGAAGTMYVRAQQSGSAGSGWSAWQIPGQDQANFGGTGSTKLPSGLIFQWGTGSTNGTYYFNRPFPSYCASLTFGAGGAGSGSGVPRGNCNTSGFSYSSAIAANEPFYYIAIGW